MTSQALEERARRNSMTHHEQMLDAQAGCAPCKLCGGKALVTDAGTGMGYYIGCENSGAFHAATGCMVDPQRLSGWAYNVMDWWNRLHTPTAPSSDKGEDHVPNLRNMVGLGDEPDNMVATGESLEWLIKQLIAWPERVDQRFTTNDRFLRQSAALTLAALKPEALEGEG